MAKGMLLLICKSGGEFVKSKDGSLTYAGGEVHTVTVTREMMYDDLKLRLAELCNVDFKSVSIKYFLPGNTRTLITLSSDKDLKRMLDFQEKCTTADAFVMGEPGFSRESLDELISRETSIIVAEPVDHVDMPLDTAGPDDASPARVGSRRKYAARRKAIKSEDASSEKQTKQSIAKSSSGAVATDALKQSLIEVDMNASPADTVKKRRRAASKRAVSDDADEGRPQKKKMQIVAVGDEMEQCDDIVCKEEDSATSYHLTDSDDDVSPEQKIASWKHRITGVGQSFKNIHEFRDALQKYAIAHRFGYRLKKNDSNRAAAVCIAEDCCWTIVASWVPSAETFTVKKFNNPHTCDEESRKPPHPKNRWLEKIIKDRLKKSPHLKPKEIGDGIAQDFGVELKYCQIWRVFGRAKEQLQGSNKLAYNQLPWYCEKVMEVNPGSFANLLTDNEKRFKCLFISLHPSIYGFQNGCRPLLFLETTPLKSKYQEVLLTATSLDGNDSFFLVAFAVTDTENGDNWEWFLQQLKSALPGSGPITFVYNREKGLKDAVLKVFPDAHHGYSMFRLMDSFWRSFKGPFRGEGRSALHGYFIAAAQTPRLSDFKRLTEQINKAAPNVYEWVRQIEPECWTTSACKGEIHNHIIEDITEPYMKVIEESKQLFITQKIDAIVNMIIELMNTRRAEASLCSETLIPSKAEKLSEEAVGAQGLRVLVSSDTVFEVHDEAIHVVDLTILDCTCLRWQASGLPCRHAIAVFNFTGRNVHDYCSRYFMAETFMLTYSESITPIPSPIKPTGEEEKEEEDAGKEKKEEEKEEDAGKEEKEEEDAGKEKEEKEEEDAGKGKKEETRDSVNVLPPCPPPASGNRKEKKARNPRSTKWVVLCSRCKEAGHNKKSCKVPVQNV